MLMISFLLIARRGGYYRSAQFPETDISFWCHKWVVFGRCYSSPPQKAKPNSLAEPMCIHKPHQEALRLKQLIKTSVTHNYIFNICAIYCKQHHILKTQAEHILWTELRRISQPRLLFSPVQALASVCIC